MPTLTEVLTAVFSLTDGVIVKQRWCRRRTTVANSSLLLFSKLIAFSSFQLEID